MKKDASREGGFNGKQPKTELDAKFLAAVEVMMSKQGIKTDRAMSIALGRSDNFLNRIRNGIQSATPEAWDALFAKYPEARDIANNVTAERISQVVGVNHGQAVGTVNGNNIYAPTTLEACQLELEQHKRDLAGVRAELEKAQQQLVDKERLIVSMEKNAASQEEIISLLRGGAGRPN